MNFIYAQGSLSPIPTADEMVICKSLTLINVFYTNS